MKRHKTRVPGFDRSHIATCFWTLILEGFQPWNEYNRFENSPNLSASTEIIILLRGIDISAKKRDIERNETKRNARRTKPVHTVPSDRCRRLVALMHRAKQSGVRTYTLDTSSLNYSTGHNVTVTLSGRHPFVGRQTVNGPVREWVGHPASSATVTCVGGKDVVTHSHVGPKTGVSFIWRPPSAHTPIQFVATVFTDTLRHRTEVTSGVLLPNSRSAILNRFARDIKDDNAGQQGDISQVDASSEPHTTSYEDTSAQTVTSGEQADDVTGNGPNYSHAIFYLCTIVASYVGMICGWHYGQDLVIKNTTGTAVKKQT
ncbi:hypothetical protein LSAT2_025638 [Lamellibrachia satsuma]|nr:hypothetical protein LSAT2_025638 [Lamellibrachia satsuma]